MKPRFRSFYGYHFTDGDVSLADRIKFYKRLYSSPPHLLLKLKYFVALITVRLELTILCFTALYLNH